MTDIVPEPMSPPPAEIPAPGPGAAPEAPRRAWRLVKSSLLRVSFAVAGLALGWGAFLVTCTLPAQAGRPAEHGAQAYVHGPASTPVITVTTLGAADAAATLRQIAGTIKFG
jgi:hypothetical protein